VLPLRQFLHRLAANHLPESKARRATAQLCQMALHIVAADVLAAQPVGAPLEGHHMVPDHTGNIKALMQPSIAAIVVEAVLEGAAHVHRFFCSAMYCWIVC